MLRLFQPSSPYALDHHSSVCGGRGSFEYEVIQQWEHINLKYVIHLMYIFKRVKSLLQAALEGTPNPKPQSNSFIYSATWQCKEKALYLRTVYRQLCIPVLLLYRIVSIYGKRPTRVQLILLRLVIYRELTHDSVRSLVKGYKYKSKASSEL